MKSTDSRNPDSLWDECRVVLDSPGVYMTIYRVGIILLSVILISMISRELLVL
jgi:hypothetical protein